MKSLGKILGLVILGLLLILVAAGFALTHLFDPNDYKDEIRELARSKAGLELDIKGDIGWSLFPWLGLELHETTLASAQTPAQPLADLRMLGLSVRVMPLLSREVQMSDIRVNGLNLTLSRDEQGRGNWEGIGQPAGRSEQTGETPEAAEPHTEQRGEASPARKPLSLDIDSLTVSDARVTYHDAKTGRQYSAESIELTTGAIREGSPIAVKLNAFFGSNQPVMRARTELQGALRFDNQRKRYQFEDMRLSGEASGEPLQGQTLTFSAQGQLLVDLAAQIAEWNSLKFTANQLRGLGELKVSELDKEAKISGALSVAQFNLREFLQGAGQQLPVMADSTALGKAELVSRLSGTANSIALEELTLKLDDSTFSGRIAISDFARQALRVDLKGDRLNLDRYLPPPSKDEPAGAARKSEVKSTQAAAVGSGSTPLPKAPTQQAWSEASVLPLDSLRKLDSEISLAIGSLTAMQLPLEGFNLRARARNGQLNLQELRGGLFGGRLDSSASLDVRPAQPLLTLQHRFNGVLVDANLEQQLCRAIATLNRKPLASEPRSQDTPFRELKGNLTLRNGVASNPDLKASIPGLTVNGNGDVDLRVLGMDYRVGILIEGDKGAMPDPACQVNERYVGIEWPLRCRGPLELGAKACRFDNDALGKVAARLAGEKLNEKIEEKLGDKVSPELKDALKGLFKR